jgi:hypothetical protein
MGFQVASQVKVHTMAVAKVSGTYSLFPGSLAVMLMQLWLQRPFPGEDRSWSKGGVTVAVVTYNGLGRKGQVNLVQGPGHEISDR